MKKRELDRLITRAAAMTPDNNNYKHFSASRNNNNYKHFSAYRRKDYVTPRSTREAFGYDTPLYVKVDTRPLKETLLGMVYVLAWLSVAILGVIYVLSI